MMRGKALPFRKRLDADGIRATHNNTQWQFWSTEPCRLGVGPCPLTRWVRERDDYR
jgi:hypothetical protein